MKRLILLFLSIILIVACLTACSNTDGRVAATELNEGDCFYLGSYPQTMVTNNSLIAQLESVSSKLDSYRYSENMTVNNLYSDGSDYYESDISLNGERYRKLVIERYRQSFFARPKSAQEDNGYQLNTVYYFKWEPVKWTVIKKNSTGCVAFSSLLLDCEPFFLPSMVNEYPVTWEQSHVRGWLNNAFYNNVFSSEEKACLDTTYNNNNDGEYAADNGNNTNDLVYLPSLYEMREAEPLEPAKGTDYAQSQGLYVNHHKYKYGEYYPDGYSWWILRNVSDYSTASYNYVMCVADLYGQVSDGLTSVTVTQTDAGLRPTITVKGDAKVTKAPQE